MPSAGAHTVTHSLWEVDHFKTSLKKKPQQNKINLKQQQHSLKIDLRVINGSKALPSKPLICLFNQQRTLCG